MPEKMAFCWSGGKDSAMALHHLRQDQSVDVACLVTTMTKDYDRISMHGVRRVLLEEQAEAVGLPLEIVEISAGAANSEYEAKMGEAFLRLKADGIQTIAFGDIFLEDLRRYRQEMLSRLGMKAIFPIWKQETASLIHRFINLGFSAIVTCVDTRALSGAFSGRRIDASFVRDLPSGVDPCGENGEFHSFVFRGPLFRKEVKCRIGGKVLRDKRFLFTDLMPEMAAPLAEEPPRAVV